eukprot:Pgem_evm1s15979
MPEKTKPAVHCKAINLASSKNHLSVLKFLHHHNYNSCVVNAIELAAKYGHLETLKYLLKKRNDDADNLCKAQCQAMDYASKFGHFDIVKFLHENEVE